MIKGVHHPVSMATSVATGTKGVCYHCLVCKADQWGCFTLIFRQALFIKIQMKCYLRNLDAGALSDRSDRRTELGSSVLYGRPQSWSAPLTWDPVQDILGPRLYFFHLRFKFRNIRLEAVRASLIFGATFSSNCIWLPLGDYSLGNPRSLWHRLLTGWGQPV